MVPPDRRSSCQACDRTPVPEESGDALQQAIADPENINAHLLQSIVFRWVFDVRVRKRSSRSSVNWQVSCPDPLNMDRLRLNRLLRQTPDLPDRS